MRAKGKQVGLCWRQEALSPPHPLVSENENLGLFRTGPRPRAPGLFDTSMPRVLLGLPCPSRRLHPELWLW